MLKTVIHLPARSLVTGVRTGRRCGLFLCALWPAAGREDWGGPGQRVRRPELRGFLLGRTVDRYAESEVEGGPSPK